MELIEESKHTDDYYGKFFIMYKIGVNIPSIIDRTISVCNEKLTWSKANITNKLPVFLVPSNVKFEDVRSFLFKNSIEYSPDNQYYLATVHNGKVYVVNKVYGIYSISEFNQRSVNSLFEISPDATTYQIIPSMNAYFIGDPKEIVNGNSDFSEYQGSLFISNDINQATQEQETQLNERIQRLQDTFPKKEVEDEVDIVKPVKKSFTSSPWFIALIILLILIVIFLVVFLLMRRY